MFNVKSRKLVLTLFCSLALVLVLTDGASADSQLDGHRMLRKRAPQLAGRQDLGDIIDIGTEGGGEDPADSISSGSSTLLPSSVSSPPPSLTLDLSLTISISQSSSSSLSESSSSSSSSSTPTPSSSPPPPQIDTPSLTPTSTSSQGQKTEIRTVTSSDSSSTGTVPPTSGATSTTKTTLTIIIALAASIGGIAVIWTLIRKWKFKPSDKFEDRMQPIDWQPTGSEGSVPGVHRANTHASFRSAGHESDHGSSQHHGNSIHRGVSPLPEHDFTPGPAHLAAVGGYADLARGPSPQPQMSQMHEAQYGVPLHHQGAYDSQGVINGQRY